MNCRNQEHTHINVESKGPLHRDTVHFVIDTFIWKCMLRFAGISMLMPNQFTSVFSTSLLSHFSNPEMIGPSTKKHNLVVCSACAALTKLQLICAFS